MTLIIQTPEKPLKVFAPYPERIKVVIKDRANSSLHPDPPTGRPTVTYALYELKRLKSGVKVYTFLHTGMD